MATIAANTSAQVALTAGNFIQGTGAGVAQVGSGARGADPLTAGDPWQIGPFERDETIHITAYSAISYEAEQPLSLPSPADRLSAAEVAAIQASVSGGLVGVLPAQATALGAPDGLTTNWPIITVTWANLPAAASFQGRICRVSDLNNALFESNGTRWKPVNGRALIGSTDASATMSGTTETVLFSKALPAGLVKDNDRLIVNYTMGKSGTSESATMAMRLGTAGTIADTAIQGPVAGLTTTSVAAGVVVQFKRVTATSTRKLGQGTQLNPMVGAGTVVVTSPVTVSSMDSNALFLSFTNVMSAAVETFTLYDFTLELVSSAA